MLLITNLTVLQILMLSAAGTAILRIWLDSKITEDIREPLKLLNESHLLGLGEKVAELSQCPHCLSVHVGCLLALLKALYYNATTNSFAQIADRIGYLFTLVLSASEVIVVGLVISMCIELLYKLSQLLFSIIDDTKDAFSMVSNFKESVDEWRNQNTN